MCPRLVCHANLREFPVGLVAMLTLRGTENPEICTRCKIRLVPKRTGLQRALECGMEIWLRNFLEFCSRKYIDCALVRCCAAYDIVVKHLGLHGGHMCLRAVQMKHGLIL